MIFEIINEGGNEDWDEFVLKTIRRRQETNLKLHPVGITGHGGVKLDGALKSTCDWISPGSNDAPEIKNVVTDPPVWSGAKVSVLDTDHIWGHGIDYRWVWRSFLRGHNVLFMDPWGPLAGWYDLARNSPDYPGYWDGRKAMRVTALCSARIDLAKAVPHPELVSTGFCLANPGKEYLAYVPNGEVNIDLSGSTGSFIAEWIHPIEGTIVAGASATAGSSQSFRTPFAGDAVLFLHRP